MRNIDAANTYGLLKINYAVATVAHALLHAKVRAPRITTKCAVILARALSEPRKGAVFHGECGVLALPYSLTDTRIAVKIKLDPIKKVKRVARKVVGTVPAAKVIVPKSERKKPKYKQRPELDY